ncbi:MAG: hypothetical protein M3680_11185 [Myxococcota bacterium]|nr:hypothetical protein [Myxococcota bacterium]
MRWIALGLSWLAVGFAACSIPPEVQAQLTCDVICGCLAGPADLDACTTGCIDEAQFRNLPEDCFECIQAHANACSTLEQDCEDLCDVPRPEPDDDAPPMDGGS